MIIAQTPRLILRHFHIVDGDAMDQVFGDAEVMFYGDGIKPKEWVRRWLRGCLEDYHQKWGIRALGGGGEIDSRRHRLLRVEPVRGRRRPAGNGGWLSPDPQRLGPRLRHRSRDRGPG